jgi:hypothetical protein
MNRRDAGNVTVLILGIVGSYMAVSAQTPNPSLDPRVGTWKLNLEKSQYAPGLAPKTQVRRIESRPDGFSVFTLVGQDAQGNPMFIQSVYKFDGKEYPEYTQTSLAEFSATGKSSNVRSVYKLLDAYTVEMTRRDPSGKIATINTQSMSRDGSTLTATLRRANGETISVQVSERQ